MGLHNMTLYKGAKLQLINQADGKPEEGGVQRIFEVTEYSYVTDEGFCIVRLKLVT